MDFVHSAGHSPLLRILLHMESRAVIMSSSPLFSISPGTLSDPADLEFFRHLAALTTSGRGISGAMSDGTAWCLSSLRSASSLSALWL